MQRIKFIDDTKSYNPKDVFVVHLSGIKSKEQLFSTLSHKLQFPDYFGANWDALFDCLRDFHWIKQKGIVLIHHELPALDKATLNIYLQTLIDAVQDWKEGEAHYLEIVFPEKIKNLIIGGSGH
jgi:RNAse (barnase) inhibitor barstar